MFEKKLEKKNEYDILTASYAPILFYLNEKGDNDIYACFEEAVELNNWDKEDFQKIQFQLLSEVEMDCIGYYFSNSFLSSNLFVKICQNCSSQIQSNISESFEQNKLKEKGVTSWIEMLNAYQDVYQKKLWALAYFENFATIKSHVIGGSLSWGKILKHDKLASITTSRRPGHLSTSHLSRFLSLVILLWENGEKKSIETIDLRIPSRKVNHLLDKKYNRKKHSFNLNNSLFSHINVSFDSVSLISEFLTRNNSPVRFRTLFIPGSKLSNFQVIGEEYKKSLKADMDFEISSSARSFMPVFKHAKREAIGISNNSDIFRECLLTVNNGSIASFLDKFSISYPLLTKTVKLIVSQKNLNIDEGFDKENLIKFEKVVILSFFINSGGESNLLHDSRELREKIFEIRNQNIFTGLNSNELFEQDNHAKLKFDKIGLQNFRSYNERQEINIAPLTFLYGQNSAGKSTFLKSILYLNAIYKNKMHCVKTDEINFGSFEDIHHKKNDEHGNPTFDCTFEILSKGTKNKFFQENKDKSFTLEVSVCNDLYDDIEKISKLEQLLPLYTELYNFKNFCFKNYYLPNNIKLITLVSKDFVKKEKKKEFLQIFNFLNDNKKVEEILSCLAFENKNQQSFSKLIFSKEFEKKPSEEVFDFITLRFVEFFELKKDEFSKIRLELVNKWNKICSYLDRSVLDNVVQFNQYIEPLIRNEIRCFSYTNHDISPCSLDWKFLEKLILDSVYIRKELAELGVDLNAQEELIESNIFEHAFDAKQRKEATSKLKEIQDYIIVKDTEMKILRNQLDIIHNFIPKNLYFDYQLESNIKLNNDSINKLNILKHDYDFENSKIKYNISDTSQLDKLSDYLIDSDWKVKVIICDSESLAKYDLDELNSAVPSILSWILAVMRNINSVDSGIMLGEEPEKHLHPNTQLELVDTFIHCLKLNEDKTNKLMLETHSEYLLLRALKWIKKTHLNKLKGNEPSVTNDDLSVYYVEQNEHDASIIKELKILPNGEIEGGWPDGFFDWSFKEKFDPDLRN